MSGLLGSAIAGIVIGTLSDRVGRKPCLVANLTMGCIGAICKYLARGTFWGFCGANFVNGLFAGTLPVGMAYASDVNHLRVKKDAEIGILVACYMIGMTGGGIAAILMQDFGLFTPLFVAAVLNALGAIGLVFFMIEPRKDLHAGAEEQERTPEELEEEANAPKELNYVLLVTIIAGAFFDNAGSSGLYPICLSPLAFNKFYADFVVQGLEPIMSEDAFRWISVMVAMTVIPAAGFSQWVYAKIGAAGGCVLGNVITAIVTIIVLQIVLINPASNGTYGGFIAVFYTGFPFTVISQLSTGPMLDMIAPLDKKGFAQGANTTVMDFSNAVSPWLLGLCADNLGTEETIWICVGISFVAATVNTPLLFAKALKREPPKGPEYSRAMPGEDEELIEKALRGEWVPREFLDDLFEARLESGKKFLVIPYNTYEQDKPMLSEFRKRARHDFEVVNQRLEKFLTLVHDPEVCSALIKQFEASTVPEEEMTHLKEDLGKWFADYMEDSGYFMDEVPILYKQMIMDAFPPVNPGGKVTEENAEQVIINYIRVIKKYLKQEENAGFITAFAGRPWKADRATSV